MGKDAFQIFTSSDLENLLSNLHDGLFIVNRKMQITYWNKAAEHITGYTVEEMTDSPLAGTGLIHTDPEGDELDSKEDPLKEVVKNGASYESDFYIHHKEGHMLPVSARISPLKDDGGNIIGGIELFTDISSIEALRNQFQELEKLALLDALTQIPNRRFLESQISSRLEEYKRFEAALGILFIDIDNFKGFNDSYGHTAGDHILKTVANTLVSSTRSYDIIGRWGGEEFIGLFPNTSIETMETIALRLQKLIRSSNIRIDDNDLSVTVSIGATAARPGDELRSFVERVDTRLYESKHKGKNQISID